MHMTNNINLNAFGEQKIFKLPDRTITDSTSMFTLRLIMYDAHIFHLAGLVKSFIDSLL
jgi:hypothetical protein